MGWTYDYLKGISKADWKDKCPDSKKGKKHEPELFFEAFYCKRCGVELRLKDN